MDPTLLLTGFEPFLDVTLNPSGHIALALHGERLGTPSGPLSVVGVELPVTFGGAPGALRSALEGLPRAPAGILSLGVHRGPAFRIERRAGARFGSLQPDNDGQVGAAVQLEGPEERTTTVEIDRVVEALHAAGAAEVTVSDDAGGYLCERIFRAGLDHGSELGIPALFVHVPPVEFVPVAEQVRVVRSFLERCPMV